MLATGKRDKQRVVPIGDNARKILEQYLIIRTASHTQKEIIQSAVHHAIGSALHSARVLETIASTSQTSRHLQVSFSSYAQTFVCDPSVGTWSRSPIRTNDAGPRQHYHHSNLHPRGTSPPQTDSHRIVSTKTAPSQFVKPN